MPSLLALCHTMLALAACLVQVGSLVAGDGDDQKKEPAPKPKSFSERIVGYWKFEAEIDPKLVEKSAKAKNISIKQATLRAEYLKAFINGNHIVIEFGKEGTGKSYTTVYVGAGNREIHTEEFTWKMENESDNKGRLVFHPKKAKPDPDSKWDLTIEKDTDILVNSNHKVDDNFSDLAFHLKKIDRLPKTVTTTKKKNGEKQENLAPQ